MQTKEHWIPCHQKSKTISRLNKSEHGNWCLQKKHPTCFLDTFVCCSLECMPCASHGTVAVWRSRGSVDDEVNTTFAAYCLLKWCEAKTRLKNVTQIPAGMADFILKNLQDVTVTPQTSHLPVSAATFRSRFRCPMWWHRCPFRLAFSATVQGKRFTCRASQQMQTLPTTWQPCRESKWC